VKGTIFEKLSNPSHYTGTQKPSVRKQGVQKDWNADLKSMTKNDVRHNLTTRKQLYAHARKAPTDQPRYSQKINRKGDTVRHSRQQLSMSKSDAFKDMHEDRAFDAAVNLAKNSMSMRLDPQVQEWLDALAQVKIRKAHGDRKPWRNSIWEDFTSDKKDKALSNADFLLDQKEKIEILVVNNVIAATEYVSKDDLIEMARLAERVDEEMNGQRGKRQRSKTEKWPHPQGPSDDGKCYGVYEFSYREWAYLVRLGASRERDKYFRQDPRAPIQKWLDEAAQPGRKKASYSSLWIGMSKDQRKKVSQHQEFLGILVETGVIDGNDLKDEVELLELIVELEKVHDTIMDAHRNADDHPGFKVKLQGLEYTVDLKDDKPATTLKRVDTDPDSHRSAVPGFSSPRAEVLPTSQEPRLRASMSSSAVPGQMEKVQTKLAKKVLPRDGGDDDDDDDDRDDPFGGGQSDSESSDDDVVDDDAIRQGNFGSALDQGHGGTADDIYAGDREQKDVRDGAKKFDEMAQKAAQEPELPPAPAPEPEPEPEPEEPLRPGEIRLMFDSKVTDFALESQTLADGEPRIWVKEIEDDMDLQGTTLRTGMILKSIAGQDVNGYDGLSQIKSKLKAGTPEEPLKVTFMVDASVDDHIMMKHVQNCAQVIKELQRVAAAGTMPGQPIDIVSAFEAAAPRWGPITDLSGDPIYSEDGEQEHFWDGWIPSRDFIPTMTQIPAPKSGDFVWSTEQIESLEVRFGRKHYAGDTELPMISWRALCNAALIGGHVQRCAYAIGEPQEHAAKRLLMNFYEEKHPEYANDDKISRIVGSFQAKAKKADAKDTWWGMMWAAYKKEGVEPQEDWKKADAVLKIQRIFRGAAIRWQRAHERERERQVLEEEAAESARRQSTAGAAQPRARGGSRNAAPMEAGAAGGGGGGGGRGDSSQYPALWARLHASLESSIGIDPGKEVSAAEREDFLAEFLERFDKKRNGELGFAEFNNAAREGSRSSGIPQLSRQELRSLFESLQERRGTDVNIDDLAKALADNLPDAEAEAADGGSGGGGSRATAGSSSFGRSGGGGDSARAGAAAKPRTMFKGLRSMRGDDDGDGDESSDIDSDDLDLDDLDLDDSSDEEEAPKKKDKKKDKKKEKKAKSPKKGSSPKKEAAPTAPERKKGRFSLGGSKRLG
jgi:hypothetical protein